MQGEIVAALLDDTSWILRRVETVHFLDSFTVERRITLDIDTDAVATYADSINGGDERPPPPNADSAAPRELEVPLARLAKGLMLDLDLVGPDGLRREVLRRDEDAEAATAYLMSHALVGDYIEPADVVWVRRVVRRICKAFPDAGDLHRIHTGAGGSLRIWRLTPDEIGGDESRTHKWENYVLGNPTFYRELLNFTASFLLMTRIPVAVGSQIYKYRYEEPVSADDVYGASGAGLYERIGWQPFVGVLPVTVGWGLSQHLRLVAPPGLFLTAANLVEERKPRAGAPRPPESPGTFRPATEDPDSAHPYERRVTTRRAHLYTGRVGTGRYRVMFTLRCVAGGLWTVVPYVAAYTTAILSIGAADPGLVGAIRSSSADAAVAILLVAPSVMSAYALQPGEHELSSQLARWPRRIASLSVVAAVIAATQFVFFGNHPLLTRWVWGTGALGSLIVVTYIALVARRVRRSYRAVTEGQNQTVQRYTRRLE